MAPWLDTLSLVLKGRPRSPWIGSASIRRQAERDKGQRDKGQRDRGQGDKGKRETEGRKT